MSSPGRKNGVTLGGTVHGDGPALVFLQGVIGDGDLDWGSTVGHLTDAIPPAKVPLKSARNAPPAWRQKKKSVGTSTIAP